MTQNARPAEVFHVRTYIQDELAWHEWSVDDMLDYAGDVSDVDRLAIEILFAVNDEQLEHTTIGEGVAAVLGRATGVSSETWMNLDRAYHAAKKGHPND